MLDVLIALGATIAGIFFQKQLANRHVQGVARAILASPDNPTTDIPVALREAWVIANHVHISKAADQLERERIAGKLRIERAVSKATEGGPHDVNILPRDGTEEFKPGWPL